MTTLLDLLSCRPVDMQRVRAHLDALGNEDRIHQVRAVPGRLQRRLYAASQGFMNLDLRSFVPEEVPDGTWVRHYGRNSLPVLTEFEKRFVRPRKNAEELWGYNFGSTMRLVGPGYFVVREAVHPAEIDIDYYRVPPETPPGGPPVRSNTSVPARFVYGFMVDVMRGVSEHVSAGRAIRRGNRTGNYFLLCREDPPGGSPRPACGCPG